jgi:hypothetical protein
MSLRMKKTTFKAQPIIHVRKLASHYPGGYLQLYPIKLKPPRPNRVHGLQILFAFNDQLPTHSATYCSWLVIG